MFLLAITRELINSISNFRTACILSVLILLGLIAYLGIGYTGTCGNWYVETGTTTACTILQYFVTQLGFTTAFQDYVIFRHLIIVLIPFLPYMIHKFFDKEI